MCVSRCVCSIHEEEEGGGRALALGVLVTTSLGGGLLAVRTGDLDGLLDDLRLERHPDLLVEAAAVHVDEDDGDVLVAGLAACMMGFVRIRESSDSGPVEQGEEEGRVAEAGRPGGYHLVKALPSLERLRTVASTRFLLRAALPVDLPPAMDGWMLNLLGDSAGWVAMRIDGCPGRERRSE